MIQADIIDVDHRLKTDPEDQDQEMISQGGVTPQLIWTQLIEMKMVNNP